MKTNVIHLGNCLEVMRNEIPDNNIDCIITSPPYWQLRDYGWDGQWGLEKTFGEYLEHLYQFMDQVWRVLKDRGTVWINLGDTYGTVSGAFTQGEMWGRSGAYLGEMKLEHKSKTIHKCKLLIPHRFAIGCIERGWIVRNDIIWAKRNAMPESVQDRFSKKYEFMFFMVKQQQYYFDLDAIRDVLVNPVEIRNKASEIYGRGSKNRQFSEGSRIWGNTQKGKNPGDVSDFWDIVTKPSKEDHYATYNQSLITKPILAGCPKGGIVLDPFCGTATTGIVSIRLGRKFIGIEGGKKHFQTADKLLKKELAQERVDI